MSGSTPEQGLIPGKASMVTFADASGGIYGDRSQGSKTTEGSRDVGVYAVERGSLVKGLSAAFFSKSCPQHPRGRRLQGFLPVNHGPLYLREEFKNPGGEWRRKSCWDRSRCA